MLILYFPYKFNDKISNPSTLTNDGNAGFKSVFVAWVIDELLLDLLSSFVITAEIFSNNWLYTIYFIQNS